VFRQYLINDLPTKHAFVGIRCGHSRRYDHGLPECPSSTSLPCRGVQRECLAKGPAAVTSWQSPSDGKIACRVADCELAKVDYCRKAAAVQQEVPHGDVSMYPNRRPLPASAQRRAPNANGSAFFDAPAQLRDCRSCLVIVDCQAPASVEIVWARLRPARRVNPL